MIDKVVREEDRLEGSLLVFNHENHIITITAIWIFLATVAVLAKLTL